MSRVDPTAFRCTIDVQYNYGLYCLFESADMTPVVLLAGPGKAFRSVPGALLIAVVGCTKAVYKGPPAPEVPAQQERTEPLLLESIDPPDGAEGVSEDVVIEFVFSRPPDPRTVTAERLLLFEEPADTPVDARIEPEQGSSPRRFHLVPLQPLQIPRVSYRIEVRDGIAGTDGIALDLAASSVTLPSRFVTRDLPDTEPPYFFYFDLRAEPAGPTAIHLRWFPALDPPGGTPPNQLTYRIYMGIAADSIDFSEPAGTTLPGQTEYTVGGLSPHTTYYFVIHAVDEAGNEEQNRFVVSAETLLASDRIELTILYTSDTMARLEPPGCSRMPEGGLARRASYFASVRSTGRTVLAVDAGDFISHAEVSQEKSPTQLRIAATFMLQALRELGYAAVNVGEGDLVFGTSFLETNQEETGVTLLSASVTTPAGPAFAQAQVVSGGGIRVGIVGLLSARFASFVQQYDELLSIAEPFEALRAGLELVRGRSDLTVLLIHAPLEETRQLITAVPGYDIAISAHDTATALLDQPELVGGTYLVQAGWEGRRVGRLDLTLNQRAELAEIHGGSVLLEDSWPKDADLENLHREYLAEVASSLEQILAEYPRRPPPEGGHYVGADTCSECHDGIWAHWRTTKHAQAWDILREAQHDEDPSCFSCHTTGFTFEGGFWTAQETPGMGGVQCEVCHGPGGDHVAEGAVLSGTSGEESCRTCHVPSHSPAFEYEEYLEQVLHP